MVWLVTLLGDDPRAPTPNPQPPNLDSLTPNPQPLTGVTGIKVLSYNVLGEYHALQALHDYAPLEWRVWGGRGGRAERVVDEVYWYDAEVVCLQEVGLALRPLSPRRLRLVGLWALRV